MINLEKHVRSGTAKRVVDKICFSVGWEICMDADRHFCRHVCPNRKECNGNSSDSQIERLGKWALEESE